ncbi:MAG: EamA family transporter [Gomphosphaeria aponina SAG 52.96 = DSM 107014]|uniref:EamA family transporter n=1 Tax=Gomphosphaeria aponina SAG 52.96 = DSM 107014 TaxID=1521640 RepID=A0A941JTE0_9CHRO|nr:EamA family transporter [Gomphosphaeria aponina SAG 52.96 = DSM 107014]
MTWVIFATCTAIFESLKDVTSKHSLQKIDEYIVSWSVMAFSLPLLLPILLLIKIPTLNSQFWLTLLVDGSLNVIALIMYIKAIKLSDLSLTVPLIAFTPLFLLITSPLIVQEYPTITDAIGIFLIVTGSYILNLKEKQKGYLAPFKSLLQQKGSKLMLGVAFIWSITSNIDKLGVQNSSPTFWAISLCGFLALSLLPIALYKSSHNFQLIPQYLPELLPLGLFNGAAILFQMQAISIALVAQVISVKRTSAMITVFLGYLIFQEQGIKERATGAGIMILGVILITAGG